MTEFKMVRDDYIVAQALYEFIRMQQARPKNKREYSNERDAIRILKSRFPTWSKAFVVLDIYMDAVPVKLEEE